MTTTTKPRRHWFQFRLRTLLVLMLLVCIGMAWLGVKMQQARRQRAAAEEIERLGGEVYWGYPHPESEPRGEAWLRKLFGDYLFTHVYFATISNDTAMEHLTDMRYLSSVHVVGTQVTDTGLQHLEELLYLQSLFLEGNQFTDAALDRLASLSELEELNLIDTNVSDSGVKKLQQSLPNCRISRWPRQR